MSIKQTPIMLSEGHKQIAKSISDSGNMSEGIRYLLEFYAKNKEWFEMIDLFENPEVAAEIDHFNETMERLEKTSDEFDAFHRELMMQYGELLNEQASESDAESHQVYEQSA